MRFFYIVLTMCLMIALIGCKKTIIEESEKESTEESVKDNNEENNDENIDETYSDFMSIAEAQKAENGEFIWLTGYIVGSCQRSMKNTDFTYPFSGSTAIILADEKVSADSLPEVDDPRLFPVCITDYKHIREELNLEDNPDLWNRRIYIVGVKQRYMSRDGMKMVTDYQVEE